MSYRYPEIGFLMVSGTMLFPPLSSHRPLLIPLNLDNLIILLRLLCIVFMHNALFMPRSPCV